MSDSSHVIETSDANFDRDVFERSFDAPVALDFWAAWCQPCRMLTPALERLAGEMGGALTVVKADVDQAPAAAAKFQVASVPSVFGVVAGEVVDFFQGVLPPAALRQWAERLVLEGRLRAARRFEATDPARAERAYRDLLASDAALVDAQVGLGRALLEQGRRDECRALVESLQARGYMEPEAEKLKAACDLAGHVGEDVASLRAACEQAPDDLARRLALAQGLAGAGRHEEALQICLDLVERDRAGRGESARRLMLEVFNVLPDDSDLSAKYRRRLSMLLS